MALKNINKVSAVEETSMPSSADVPDTQNQVQGRGAFIVEMTAAGVAVASTVVTDDGRALAMPAIFPNLGYALSQIDEMRALVIRNFEQASQIGAQVIAQQQAQLAAEQSSADKSAPVSAG